VRLVDVTIVTLTLTVLVTLPAGFAPSGARLTSRLAEAPGCAWPGLLTW